MSEPAAGRLLPIATYVRVLISKARQALHQADEAEALLVWKQFRFNWLLLAVVLAIFDLCLLVTDFRIHPLGYLFVLALASAYGGCGYWIERSSSNRPRVFAMLTALAQTILALAVMTSLSYIATAADLPLQDSRLLAADQAIGFDFRALLKFVNGHVWLIEILVFGYNAISWQIWLIVLLPLVGQYQRTAEYISASMIALVVTCCITMIVPAVGAYHTLGLVAADFPNINPQSYYETLTEIPSLRAGALRTLDLGHLLGVVTFPSFHAATAVLYGWALWPLRWARPLNLAVNGTMLLATPICGGHYLVDVLAGVTVAISSIYAARYGAKLIDVLGQRRRLDIVAYQAQPI
jgi:PAP2 superfamily protein